MAGRAPWPRKQGVMRSRLFPHPTSSAQRDPWLLALAAGAWIPVAWWRPDAGIAAVLGCALTLACCKTLGMPPATRAFVAPLPVAAALPWLGTDAGPGLAGALLAAGGYLGFTLARLCVYLAIRTHRRCMQGARAWLSAWRFHAPDGTAEGWDYGRWLVLRERWLARLRPRARLRILFPPTDMEAELREGFRHRGDRLRFADPTPEELRAHDVVVPITLQDLERLRAFAPLLARNPLPLPDAACVALCDDKLACNRALSAAGFAHCVPEIADTLPFPYILKKRIDAWGDNAHVVANEADEARLAALLRDPDYFRQAFVPGQREYAAHLLVRDGRIVAALAVEYVFVQALHKKSREQPPHYRRLRRPSHLPLFRDMLAAIGYEGLCCINYKIEDGRVRLLEINPRFGASLAPWFFSFARALRPMRTRAGRARSAADSPLAAEPELT